MLVKYFKSKVSDPRQSSNPIEVITENCSRLNSVLKYMEQLSPKRVSVYATALKQRLKTEIEGFNIDHGNLDFEEILRDYDHLVRFPELRELMIQFVYYHLKIPETYKPTSEELEVNLLDWLRASNVFRYYRVMAIIDIMDRHEAIQLWKDMVYRSTQDFLNGSEDEIHPPIKEITEGWIKEGENAKSSFELTIVSYDDHKVALRFDRCPVFESVKHLEDREIAYLSYCWTGKPEQEMNRRTRRKNTPQTLYQSDYCVEFFWDNNVHPGAQPPTEEFWREIESRGE